MKKRVFLSILLLCLILVPTVISIGVKSMHDANLRQQDAQLTKAAKLISLVDDSRDEVIEELDDKYYAYYRTTYIDPNGNVLFDSNVKDVSTLPNHKDRPEVMAAFEKGEGKAVRNSQTIGEELRYQAVKLQNGDVVRLSYKMRSLYGILRDSFVQLLFLTFGVIIICALVAGVIANYIIKPLNKLEGNFDKPIEGYNELAPFWDKISSQKYALEQKSDESAIRSKQLDEIVQNMREGLILLNDKMHIVSFNTSVKNLLNFDDNVKEGQHVFAACRNKEFLEAIKRLEEYGEPVNFVIDLEGKYISCHASPVKTNNIVTGYVLLLVDISEEHNLEKARREFSSNVSHELKTPLTTISGYAEIIENGFAKSKDIPEFGKRIHTEAKRLVVLIEDIMRLSRLDEGEKDLDRENVDVYALCEDIVNRFKDIAEAENISLNLKGEKAFVYGVKQTLSEMFTNLVDNAIKYNVPNGSVDVSVESTSKKVIVSIRDTGVGIASKHHKRIFERFYRVDKSHSKATGGTGLGLSIVKNGAALHNAKIDLDSAPDKGTTITITFDNDLIIK